jgi:NTP pyrophosphatase (non-canonical NTP hydrolase)
VQKQREWRREKVEKFAARMQEMAQRKAGKGTWLEYTLSQAMGELMAEVGEIGEHLQKGALNDEEKAALQWECVDVAISAMILADLVDTFPEMVGIRYAQKAEGLREVKSNLENWHLYPDALTR